MISFSNAVCLAPHKKTGEGGHATNPDRASLPRHPDISPKRAVQGCAKFKPERFILKSGTPFGGLVLMITKQASEPRQETHQTVRLQIDTTERNSSIQIGSTDQRRRLTAQGGIIVWPHFFTAEGFSPAIAEMLPSTALSLDGGEGEASSALSTSNIERPTPEEPQNPNAEWGKRRKLND
jgi:hypothetical protein